MKQDSQHQEHRAWLSQLDFYQDEIKIFQNELSGVVQQHPNYLNMVEHVEEYRGILLRKLQRIDDLRHIIVLHDRALARQDSSLELGHAEVKNRVATFVQDFESMKANFRRFVAHNN